MLEPQSIPEPIVKRREAITLYQVAVIALAAIGLLSVVGVIVLAFFGRTAPDAVVVLGTVSITALAGMIAPAAVRGADNA